MSYNNRHRGLATKMTAAAAPLYKGPSSGYSSAPSPFGPGMAEDIFGVSRYDSYGYDEAECIEEYYPTMADLDPEDLFNGELQSFHFRYQGTFDLETNDEREQRLLNSMKRFERAYRVMAVAALKWHYLLEDVEEDEELKKMFHNIQMLRKLKGSDTV